MCSTHPPILGTLDFIGLSDGLDNQKLYVFSPSVLPKIQGMFLGPFFSCFQRKLLEISFGNIKKFPNALFFIGRTRSAVQLPMSFFEGTFRSPKTELLKGVSYPHKITLLPRARRKAACPIWTSGGQAERRTSRLSACFLFCMLIKLLSQKKFTWLR